MYIFENGSVDLTATVHYFTGQRGPLFALKASDGGHKPIRNSFSKCGIS